jgi:uncharacterized protein YbaR (Trm112 family)
MESARNDHDACGCDAELLKLLCCPETHQSLTPATQLIVQELNQAIQAGRVKSKNGEEVLEKIEGGLVRADRKVLYPIRHNIPVMLVDESIPLP